MTSIIDNHAPITKRKIKNEKQAWCDKDALKLKI